MPFKKHENMIGGITIGDIKQAIEGRDNDDIVYLDGFDFYACETHSGNIEFSAEPCKDKELW